MKRGNKWLGCLLSGLALAAGATAAFTEDSGNPYQGIVDRNVFNLKPLAPAVPPIPPPPPLPKLTMTGIFTILGKKQVGLKAAVPAKPPEPAREESYILAEGQMKDEIEIVSIDVAGGRIEVKNHGFPQSLNFTNDGAKLVAVAAPVPAPGGVNPAIRPYQPPVTAAPANPAVPQPTRTIPPRAMRLPQNPQNTAVQPGVTPQYGAAPATGQLGFGTANPQSGTINSALANSPAAHMSPEEQMIMIEVERERTKEAVARGQMPALPQTPVTPQPPQEAPQ